MECLTDLIGITKTDCPCIINGASAEQKTAMAASKSGLYIDTHIEGGLNLRTLKEVDGCRKMAEIALSARDAAVKALRDNLLEAMNTRYKASKTAYVGDVGQMSYAMTLAVTARYQTLLLRSVDYSDSTVKVNRIQLVLNAARTITLHLMKIYEGDTNGTEIGAWPVTTTANAYSPVNFGGTPLKLPLKENGHSVNYMFWYDTQEGGGGFQPKDNKVDCNCGVEAKSLKSFLYVTGGQMSNINDMNTRNSDEFTHGIILSVDIRCDNDRLICLEYQDDDAIAVAISWALLLKTEVYLIEKVFESTEVTRMITQAKEYLWGKRSHYNKEYDMRITYLARTIDVSASDCYICREKPNQPKVSTIFS